MQNNDAYKLQTWPAPVLFPVTAQFKPGLAFRMTLTPTTRRAWAAYIKRRNFQERQGRPIKFWGSPACTEEMHILRREIAVLQKKLVDAHKQGAADMAWSVVQSAMQLWG